MRAQRDSHCLSNDRPRLKSRDLFVVLALIVIVVGVFYRVITNEFVHYDDDMNIVNNAHVNGLSAENIRWMLTDMGFSRYMPLGWFCYAFDRQLFGLNSHFFHAGNLLVHLANTVLLFVLVKKIVL